MQSPRNTDVLLIFQRAKTTYMGILLCIDFSVGYPISQQRPMNTASQKEFSIKNSMNKSTVL